VSFQIESFSYEIVQNSQQRAESLFAMLHTLAVTMSVYGVTTTDSAWPYETLPSFENVAAKYREVTHSRMIATLPLIPADGKSQWETYASTDQGWIQESYETLGFDIVPLPINPTIYDFVDGHATEALEGPFMPLWQMSPPPSNTGIVNYNMMSEEHFATGLKVAVDVHEALLTPITDLSILIDNEPDTHESLLIQPVLIDADAPSSQVVACILASISWDVFFTDLVREGNKGMLIVLKNSCGDSLTWKLNGRHASFVSLGDAHDRKYTEYANIEKLTPFLTTTAESTPGFCEYEINVYPTSDIEGKYITKAPTVYTTIIVMVFVGLAIAFLVYDHLVQQRQQQAQEQAEKSEAIVQSMFPAEIRDRLFKGEGKDASKRSDGDEPKETQKFEGQKFRLKTFLDTEEALDAENSGIIKESKPIADLFPNTTVMFADISGFTAWSSVREPSQVFTLLETVYKAFDKTAKRRKVFKVETVG
jgi:hypothetical protein